ncbi:hypothetical protein R1flu_021511 [Riccia fluitans]|uniref:Uncharacterized protein n=1 Tax=Riccia fluitans TaxID=41844 RepID=A0ABD1ZPK4_9MARC
MMKAKVQFMELQLLKLVKGDKRLSKSGVVLKQVEGNPDFILFCQSLNSILAPVKGLGVFNEPTRLGPNLVHVYLHFNELHNEKMEGPKKRKAQDQP